ncbi:MAG TPA: hypothetical protein VFQ88_04195 [Nevskiaceae bacterium]|nr:hypothetical protein [Nevskiaceae bacterium]
MAVLLGASIVAVPAVAAPGNAAVAALSEFHDDIKAGRTDAALALLAPDVLIAQQGYVDVGRDHYAGARITNDEAFARATRYQRVHRQVVFIDADATEVVTQLRRSGNFNGTPVDIIRVETALLLKRHGKWQIGVLHWSAHPAPAAHAAGAGK